MSTQLVGKGKEGHIEFDPHDWRGMKELCEKHEDFPYACTGENEEGETVMISVNEDNITVVTFQSNGWARENVYWVDDYTVEELFHGPKNVQERYLS